MLNLAEYRRANTRLADFLPWAALVAEGAVLNKDGSFQRTAKFRGPDLDSAVRPLALGLPDTANKLVLASAQETRIGGTWRQQLQGRDSHCPTAAAVAGLQTLGKSLRGDQARVNEQVYALLARKQELVNRARRAVALKARLDLWLFIHVPLSLALVAALIAHIVSVFFYW